MHFVLKFFEYLGMVIVCVSKQAVEPPYDVEEVLGARCRNCNPRTEVVRILNYGGGIVQSMNHIVNC